MSKYPTVKDPDQVGSYRLLQNPAAVMFGMKYWNTGFGVIDFGKSKCFFPERTVLVANGKGKWIPTWSRMLDLFGIPCD